MKNKFLISTMIICLASISAVGCQSAKKGQPEDTAKSAASETQANETSQSSTETQSTEAGTEATVTAAAAEESSTAPSSPVTLAISGKYDDYCFASNGLAIVCKDKKWGLVTYDDKVIVPLEYKYCCGKANDDLQTYFGNDGDYKVFDKDGKMLYETDKAIKGVSDGVVLWYEADKDKQQCSFGYVKLDGTPLYTPEKQSTVYGDSGAVGFNEGCAFFTTYTDYKLLPDGTSEDRNAEFDTLRKSNSESSAADSGMEGNGTDASSSVSYPIGICRNGKYMTRGIDESVDSFGCYIIRDSKDVMDTQLLNIRDLSHNVGIIDDDTFKQMKEDPDIWYENSPAWSLKSFVCNGNNCFNYDDIVNIYLTDYNDKTQAYLIDTSKIKDVTDQSGEITETDFSSGAILLQADEININDEKYWLAYKDKKWSFVDHSGKIIQTFDDATNFENGRALVIKDGEAYYTDEDMNLTDTGMKADSVIAYGDMFVINDADNSYCITFE